MPLYLVNSRVDPQIAYFAQGEVMAIHVGIT